MRDAINAYKKRGSNVVRVKGGAGGGTGVSGTSGAGTAGTWPANANTAGAPGGKGTSGTGGAGGAGGRGGGVVMVFGPHYYRSGWSLFRRWGGFCWCGWDRWG